MNKVSVIIPVYNLGDALNSSLNSVINQTFDDLEIVVVDDASTDGSGAEACKILAGSGREYKVITHDRNCGVSCARNNGLKCSSGEYVVFIDGDDLLEKNFISALLSALEASDADYAACGYQRYEVSSDIREDHFLDVARDIDGYDVLIGRILNKIEISLCATLDRRAFLTENDLFYENGSTAGEDIEFLIKMLCHRPRGVFIRDCLYIYVQHEDMGSRKGVAEKSGRLQRYEHHTEAHFREAEYIMRHTRDGRLSVLAENMLLPLAYLRRLSVYAMRNEKTNFYELLESREIKKILFRSYHSFMYKPEVFLRSLIALLAPQLYYKKYNHYLDR